MTHLYRNVWRMPLLWSGRAWIWHLDSNGTAVNAKTTSLNSKRYESVFILLVWKSALIQPKIPGTKRVDHNRAVKIYERAAGDKSLPSDLRPPMILKVCMALDLFRLYVSSSCVENAGLPLP